LTRLLLPLIILFLTLGFFPSGNSLGNRQKELVFSESAFGNQISIWFIEEKDFGAFIFENRYTLELQVHPEGAGTVFGAGGYVEGEMVSISTSAEIGYSFEKWLWDNGIISEISSFTFEMPAEDVTLVANFYLNTYTISASSNPNEGGIITGADDYHHGQNVNLSATADQCYIFENWTENEQVISEEEDFGFIATSDRHLTANFSLKNFQITASSGEGGSIIPLGEVSVNCGQAKEFQVIPAEGYAILDVKVDGVGIGPSNFYEFIDIGTDHSIEALFIPFITGPNEVCLGEWSSYELNSPLFSEYAALKWVIQNGGGRIFGPDDSDLVMIQWGNVSGTQYLNLQVFIDPHPTPSNYVIEIEVSGTPPPEAVILRKGENILLVDEVSGPLYDEYQWGIMNATSFSDTFLGGENNQFCWFDNINTSSKYYWVETMQSGNGCKVRSFFNDPTGQQDDFLGNDLFDILLFPVPARQNIVYARWPVFPFNQLEISLITFDGKELRNFQFNFSEVNMPLKLDLAELPPGLYLLRFSFDKRQITKRLLIQ